MATLTTNIDKSSSKPHSSDVKASAEIHTSRALRRLAQRNAVERSAYDEHQRRLTLEKRSVTNLLDREEKELKEQLVRLQEEKLHLHGHDGIDLQESLELTSQCDLTSECQFSMDLSTSPSPVVNPYPVAFPARCGVQRSSRQPAHTDERLQSGGQQRRGSGAISSLDLSPSKLPPIPSSGKMLSPSDANLTSLSRADSSSSIKSISPKEKKEFWVGDPEAISSVRRARKTPREQRIEQNWVRSHSLKERASRLSSGDSTSSLSRRSGPISRSQSMREKPNAAIIEPKERSWSRTESWKDAAKRAQRLAGSIENLSEALAAMSPSPICGRPRRAKSLKVKLTNPKSNEISPIESPNTRAAAWIERSESFMSRSSSSMSSGRDHLKSQSAACFDTSPPLPEIVNCSGQGGMSGQQDSTRGSGQRGMSGQHDSTRGSGQGGMNGQQDSTRGSGQGRMSGQHESTRGSGQGGMSGQQDSTRGSGQGGMSGQQESTRGSGQGGMSGQQDSTRGSGQGGMSGQHDSTRA